MPWNQSTLIGYLAEVFYGTFLCEVFIVATGSVLCLFMSMSWHHEAFFFMFRYSVRKLDKPETNNNNKKIIFDLVRFHMMVKEWVSILKIFNRYVSLMIANKCSFIFKMVSRIGQSLQFFHSGSVNLLHDLDDLCRFSIGFGNYGRIFIDSKTIFFHNRWVKIFQAETTKKKSLLKSFMNFFFSN